MPGVRAPLAPPNVFLSVSPYRDSIGKALVSPHECPDKAPHDEISEALDDVSARLGHASGEDQAPSGLAMRQECKLHGMESCLVCKKTKYENDL